MSDGASLPEAIFRSLRTALHEQDLYQVREIAAKQFDDDRALLREIASARYIISAMPLAYLGRIRLREETETIILNETAFSLIRKSYSNLKQKQYEALRREMSISQVMISSDELIASAAEYFHVWDASSYRIKGSCRSDLYFDKEYCLEARQKLEKEFPAARGKKVIVYLPMVRYRSTKSGYKYFMNLKYLRSRISDQYVVAVNVRLPRGEYTQNLNINGFSKVMNGLIAMPQLLCAADVVVGDYRDTFFETPLLHKPAFMLTNDSYNFLKNRSTACDFAEAQIGPTIRSEEELAEQLERIESYDFTMQDTFRKKYLTYCDGNSARRVVDYIRMH